MFITLTKPDSVALSVNSRSSGVHQSTRMAALATKVMSKLRNSFMFNSIEGESKQFDTARMRTKLVKSSVKNMLR